MRKFCSSKLKRYTVVDHDLALCQPRAGYGLSAVFGDGEAGLCVDFVPAAAQSLLHMSLVDLWELTPQERRDILSSFSGVEMALCVSKVSHVS